MVERDWLIGRVLGKYRLEKLIGSGAFASIYEAVHIHLHVPFAIKILHPALANEAEVLERFIREARAASQLQHENVVFIADFEVEEGVGPYIVMEYLEGDTLKHYLSQHKKLPLELVGEIARQICLALGQAHRKNIIHRDLKPENIFLVQREMGRVLVKILDFGIAHFGKVTDSITGSRLIGTPVYMAPEQFRGVAQSPSIDIYSFGVILYEMLMGKTPFIGHNVQQLGIEHLLMPAPEIDASYPSALRQLQARLLGKTSDERPSSMEEVWMLMAPALDPEGRFPHWHRQDQHIFTGSLMPAVPFSAHDTVGASTLSSNYPTKSTPSVSDTQDQAPSPSVNDTQDHPKEGEEASADHLPAADFFAEQRETTVGPSPMRLPSPAYPLPSGEASDLLASLRPLEEDIFEGAATMVGPLRHTLPSEEIATPFSPAPLQPDAPTQASLAVYGGAAAYHDEETLSLADEELTSEEIFAPAPAPVGKAKMPVTMTGTFRLSEGKLERLVIEEDQPPPPPPHHNAKSTDEIEFDLQINEIQAENQPLWQDLNELDELDEAPSTEFAIKPAPHLSNALRSTSPAGALPSYDVDEDHITEINAKHQAESSYYPQTALQQPAYAAATAFSSSVNLAPERQEGGFSHLSTVRTKNPMLSSERESTRPSGRIPPPKSPPPILGGAAASASTASLLDEEEEHPLQHRLPTFLHPLLRTYQRMNPLERKLLLGVWLGALIVLLSVIWLLWPDATPKEQEKTPPALTREVERQFISANDIPILVFDERGKLVGTTPFSIHRRAHTVKRYRLAPPEAHQARYHERTIDINFDPNEKTQIPLTLKRR